MERKLPPRYTPDNSPEVRAQRIRRFALVGAYGQVTEIRNGLPPLGNNIIELPLREEPDDIVA